MGKHIDELDYWEPGDGLVPYDTLAAHRNDADADDLRAELDPIAIMLRVIKRVDGVDLGQQSLPYIRSYFETAIESGRFDEPDGDPDLDDLSHRSVAGRNAAVKDPSTAPDVSNMDLRQVKAVALAIGAYDLHLRTEISESVLGRLRELGADKLADLYAQVWSGDALFAPSDDEAELAGEAHADRLDTSEEIAAKRLTVSNRRAVAKGGRNGKKRK